MAKRSITRKRKKCNRKKWVSTPQAPLCALGTTSKMKPSPKVAKVTSKIAEDCLQVHRGF